MNRNEQILDYKDYTLRRLAGYETAILFSSAIPLSILVSAIITYILCRLSPVSDLTIAVLFFTMPFIIIFIAVTVTGAIIINKHSRQRKQALENDPHYLDPYIVPVGEPVTEKEKNLIKRIYLKAGIAKALLIATAIMLIFGGIGIVASDFLLGGSTDFQTLLILWLVLLITCMVAFTCLLFSCRLASMNDTWDRALQKSSSPMNEIDNEGYMKKSGILVAGSAAGSLVKRAGGEAAGSAMQMAAGIGAGLLLFNMLSAISTQAESLAGSFGVKLANTKAVGTIIILVPCIILSVALAHNWTTNAAVNKAIEETVKEKIDEVDSAFSSQGGRIQYHNIEKNRETLITGYLDMKDHGTNVSISVLPAGEVSRVSYFVEVDTDLSKEEALSKAENDYAAAQKIVSEIEMDNRLKAMYEIPEELKKDILASDKWESILDEDDGYGFPKYYSLSGDEDIKAQASFEILASTKKGDLFIDIRKNE